MSGNFCSWDYVKKNLFFLSKQSFLAKKAAYSIPNWRCDSVPFRKM